MVDPITAGLTGLALLQKSVEFIKSNIQTVNDIRDIAGAIDGMFQGEKEIQQQRFGKKSLLGQHKDAAASVIDSKLAQEQLYEMSVMIDMRFGNGTWQQILQERANRIQAEREQAAAIRKAKLARRQQFNQIMLSGGVITGICIFLVVVVYLLTEFL